MGVRRRFVVAKLGHRRLASRLSPLWRLTRFSRSPPADGRPESGRDSFGIHVTELSQDGVSFGDRRREVNVNSVSVLL